MPFRAAKLSAMRRLPHLVLLLVAVARCAGDAREIPLPDLAGAERRTVVAVEAARSEIRSRPNSAESWGRLADILAANGWRRESARCYAEAERLEPSRFEWPYLLGHALSLRDLESARAAFERALAIDGSYSPARIHLARTLIRLDRVDEARAQFERALATDPDNVDALLELSKLDLDTGRHGEARARLERAHEIDPEPSELHHALAQVYLIVGENDLARRFAASADAAPPSRTMDDPRRERALPGAGS